MSWGSLNGPSGKKAVVTFKNGKVTINLEGFPDNSCAKVMDELTSHMKVVKHIDKPEAAIPQKKKNPGMFN